MIVLHLLPPSEYSAASRQAQLLAPALRSLTHSDVHVAALGRRRWFDPGDWRRLWRLVRDLRPDIIHAWRLPALRAATALRVFGRRAFRLVISEPRRAGSVNVFDHRLLRTADAVIAGYPAEVDALRRLGVPTDRIHDLPPVVAMPPAEPPTLGLTLPPGSKIIICVGSLTPAHGFRDAIQAADILRYPIPETHLVIIGEGPERRRLAEFARGLNPAGAQLHFVPARPDAAAVLARADVVWVPSRSDCGRQVLLEAQAAGRPVVATRRPGLAALVEDGRTGLLVPPGDPAALARRTQELLNAPSLAVGIAAAAGDAVASFAPERAAAVYAALYEKIGRP